MNHRNLLSALTTTAVFAVSSIAGMAHAADAVSYKSYQKQGTTHQTTKPKKQLKMGAKESGEYLGVDIWVVNESGYPVFITSPLYQPVDSNFTGHITSYGYSMCTPVRLTTDSNGNHPFFEDSCVCNYATISVSRGYHVDLSSFYCD